MNIVKYCEKYVKSAYLSMDCEYYKLRICKKLSGFSTFITAYYYYYYIYILIY